jgi:hypothetical protein
MEHLVNERHDFMKLAHLTSRVAVGGVTAALATAGLVGVTTTTALAAPISSTYTCTPPVGSPFDVPVSVDLAALPATAVAGFPVPSGVLSFPSTATISALVQTAPGGLDSLGVTGAKSDDFGTAIGDTAVKAPVTWTKPATPNSSGNYVYTGTAVNGALVLPKAGTYTLVMPKTFHLVTTGATAVPATCTTASPATISSITLSKQAATIKAKAPKSAKKGAAVNVKGKVTNEFGASGGPAASGKVIVKDGKKKVGTATIKNGKFKVKVKGLTVGSHTLTVSYKGDDFTNKGVSKALKLTVKA